MRILSVDDDPIILDLLTEILASVGHADVTIAQSASKAFEILKNNSMHFDCFLLDIQMPEIDGIQLCGALRRMPQYRRTPILMITAMSDKSYIDKAFAAGATDYVTKPFDVTELSARVRVAEKLVDAQRYNTGKIANINAQKPKVITEKPYFLDEKLSIDNVDGVIDYIALENYVNQLSRGSLFDSAVIAFHISEVDRIFKGASAFDFECLITDVAEAITQCFIRSQFLVSYAGNGTFVCVHGSNQKLLPDSLEEELGDIISSMELCYSDARPILFKIVAGKPFKLSLRSGPKIVEALKLSRSFAENRDIEPVRFHKKTNPFKRPTAKGMHGDTTSSKYAAS